MTSYINEQLITSKLIIDPKDLANDIDTVVKHKLKSNVEGRCYEDGYIITDSISIIRRNMGKVVTNNGQSKIKYLITYKAKVISPSEGDEITVYINNINKMGVIGFIKLNIKDTETMDDSPLIVMVPREYFQESSRNIEDLTIGQQFDVLVVGSRVKFHSDKIQIIAKPI